MPTSSTWPDNRQFAFTILDDTDDTTVDNGKPVYDFLYNLGMRTTKTVWALDTPEDERGIFFEAETLAQPHYEQWVHELARAGFEIAFHNARMNSSPRDDTIRALNHIEQTFHQKVRLHCNHGYNRENLHWGNQRYKSAPVRLFLNALQRFRPAAPFEGDNPDSPWYWADIADQRIDYIRAFAFNKVNGLDIPPGRPFIDPLKQERCIFFNTADAPNVYAFNRLITTSQIDRLQRNGGWCILSTHLGKGFYRDGKLDPTFRDTMKNIADRDGWFVPVSQLLDHLVARLGKQPPTPLERLHMETSHLIDRVIAKIHYQEID